MAEPMLALPSILAITRLVHWHDLYSSDVCDYSKLSDIIGLGNIVLCEYGRNITTAPAQEAAVNLAGGVGTIISSRDVYAEFLPTLADIHPGVTVSYTDAREIYSYLRSTMRPVARIEFHGTMISQSPSAPRVASFSSRGPNRIAAEILKPDLIAPGVDILAAWSGENPPSSIRVDDRRVEFSIIYGTSMACPHVSGIAAMLKVARPSWSPAAIKSALMTTAFTTWTTVATPSSSCPRANRPGRSSSAPAMSTPINRALDPGLVYDATADDYITFLCSLGYTRRQISLFTNDGSVTDCSTRPQGRVGDLNYPAFSFEFRSYFGGRLTQRRSVTNVGTGRGAGHRRCRRGLTWTAVTNANAVYSVNIASPPGTAITVSPMRLAFSAQRRTLNYSITMSAAAAGPNTYRWGSIFWSDGQHTVRSPVAVILQ
uniref:Peptidase S8/S53 domain-containing protein n=1 Tax=Oryza meridionalis TaxID=40149 RepID=A0A0E0CS87_9ORYZ